MVLLGTTSLDPGTEPDTDSSGAVLSIMEAAARKDLAALEASKAAGKNVNEQNAKGATALILSCAGDYEDYDVMAWLLDNGADINLSCKNGDTALHWAAFAGDENTVQTLINYEADVEAVGDLRNRPLHLASARGHHNAAARLLGAGASVAVKNTFGNDPLKLAKTLEINKLITRVMFDVDGSQRQKILDELSEAAAKEILDAQTIREEEIARLNETTAMSDEARMRRDAEDAEEDRLEEEELLRVEEDRMALQDIEIKKQEEEERLRREEEDKLKKKKKKGKGKGKGKGKKK